MAAYQVFIVLDREFGPRVSQLVELGPVWMVDTDSNRAAAKQFWADFPMRDHLTGVTIFSPAGSSPEEQLVAELNTIDEHHGIYSADPPYTVLEIMGAALTERVETEMSRYGFDEYEKTPGGFRATRPLPQRSDR